MQELTDEMLIHFGTKGMKWGIRQSKSKTGVSRARGDLLDANSRSIHRTKSVLKGDKANSPIRQRAGLKIAQTAMGKKRVERILQKKVDNLSAQSERVKSGRLTFADRLAVFGNVSVLGLVASNTPK